MSLQQLQEDMVRSMEGDGPYDGKKLADELLVFHVQLIGRLRILDERRVMELEEIRLARKDEDQAGGLMRGMRERYTKELMKDVPEKDAALPGEASSAFSPFGHEMQRELVATLMGGHGQLSNILPHVRKYGSGDQGSDEGYLELLGELADLCDLIAGYVQTPELTGVPQEELPARLRQAMEAYLVTIQERVFPLKQKDTSLSLENYLTAFLYKYRKEEDERRELQGRARR